MASHASVLSRTISTPLILIALLVVLAALGSLFGEQSMAMTVTEMMLRVMIVVGLYTFIGNSGVISFGHIGFMCIGAYATAWFTIKPAMKKIMLRGLPEIIAKAELPFLLSVLIATLFTGLIAYLFGRILMRLSGIAASIATFAMLAVINTIYSNWESVTGATSSVVGIPMHTGLWTATLAASGAIIIAYLYAISRSGLALRAARDEAIAAVASGVDIPRERLIAWVLSALIIGAAGALYAHFLGVVNPDAFYMNATFITLSMLVVGGMNSLSGAVIGAVTLSVIIEVLRWFESGVSLGSITLAIPNGVQEIAIGVVMIIILMFRPAGLTNNQEIVWRRWPFARPIGRDAPVLITSAKRKEETT